jgi:hypothetical protein
MATIAMIRASSPIPAATRNNQGQAEGALAAAGSW